MLHLAWINLMSDILSERSHIQSNTYGLSGLTKLLFDERILKTD